MSLSRRYLVRCSESNVASAITRLYGRPPTSVDV